MEMKLLSQECGNCINLFGYQEIRCAFCKDKKFYKDYLKEVN